MIFAAVKTSGKNVKVRRGREGGRVSKKGRKGGQVAGHAHVHTHTHTHVLAHVGRVGQLSKKAAAPVLQDGHVLTGEGGGRGRGTRGPSR